jgi:hypothetical protein
LAVGRERLSWRVGGLIGGACCVFIIFSQLLFPDRDADWTSTYWFPEEWAYYFQPAGPGDLLLKFPVLVLGVVLPLVALRVWHAVGVMRRRGVQLSKLWSSRWLQFGFSDVAVWTISLSFALAAIYQTAPYEGWFEQLYDHLRSGANPDNVAFVYSVTSALVYVVVTLAVLWAVFRQSPWWLRVLLVLTLAVGPAGLLDTWFNQAGKPAFVTESADFQIQAASETATSVVASAVILGSLTLVVLYERATDRRTKKQSGYRGDKFEIQNPKSETNRNLE